MAKKTYNITVKKTSPSKYIITHEKRDSIRDEYLKFKEGYNKANDELSILLIKK